MPPAVTLSVHLKDSNEFECLSYPTCYAPFVAIRLAEGVDLGLRDVATVEALAVVVAEAHQALLEIEAAGTVS